MSDQKVQLFTEAVRTRRQAMWRVAYHLLHSDADAEDAVFAFSDAPLITCEGTQNLTFQNFTLRNSCGGAIRVNGETTVFENCLIETIRDEAVFRFSRFSNNREYASAADAGWDETLCDLSADSPVFSDLPAFKRIPVGLIGRQSDIPRRS